MQATRDGVGGICTRDVRRHRVLVSAKYTVVISQRFFFQKVRFYLPKRCILSGLCHRQLIRVEVGTRYSILGILGVEQMVVVLLPKIFHPLGEKGKGKRKKERKNEV